MLELASRLETAANSVVDLPSEWLEKFYYVPEPRDPVTGEFLSPGPIRLAEHQKRIIDEALSVDEKGNFKYATIIYSAPKKSGKSAITAGVAKYMGFRYDYASIFCLANDGKQSNDRLYGPIYTSFQLHNRLNGPYKDKVRLNLTDVILPNYTKIEAIPCDAAGEAGSQPTATFWSELWGFETELKMRLWTEMTIPPTRWGRAIRWVESYAGFKGQSILLENIYDLAVTNGEPHPDFLDLVDEQGNPVVWINESAKTFAYWDTVPRMIWQTEEYYEAESKILQGTEFKRIHKNQWVSPVGSFIEPEWWDACQDTGLPKLGEGSRTPAVVGADAAISGDCAALVLITRDPKHPDTDIAVRAVKVFKPGKKGINLEKTIGKTIREWGKRYNIVCVAYDAYQMEKLAQDYRRGLVAIPDEEISGLSEEEKKAYIDRERKAATTWYFNFNQQGKRAVADKRLHDMILTRNVHWNPNDLDSDIAERGSEETLTKHIKQAGAETTKDKMLRISKLSDLSKIDAAVALSMAVDRCMTMNIDNRELNRDEVMQQLRKGDITLEEFNKRMAEIAMQMRVRDDEE
jgi:hypothetical protein